MNCDDAEGGSPSEEGSSPLPANETQFKSENVTRADKQRGNFTAGSLAEPARPHHLESIAEGRGAFPFATSKCPQI